MMDKEEFIDFQHIRSSFKIHDSKLSLIYLKELFKDLSDRTESDKKMGVSKTTFIEYMKLPIFISDKLFSCFDKDNNNYLNCKEFTDGLFNLYFGNFEETIITIFEVYDFDKDGKILHEDVRLILSHLPLKNNNENIVYRNQIESQDEINDIILKTFQNKCKLTFREFCDVTENVISDIYFQLLCFFYQKRPFNEENVNVYRHLRCKSIDARKEDIGHDNEKDNLCNNLGRKFKSPNKNTHLSPADYFIKLNEVKKVPYTSDFYKMKRKQKIEEDVLMTPEKSALKGMIRMPNKLENNEHSEDQDINNIIKNSKNKYHSPSSFFHKKPVKNKESNVVKNIALMDNFYINSEEEEDFNQSKNTVTFEGVIYKLTQNQNIKSFWVVLIGKDIFYYKTKEKTKLKGMHNLSGCFVKEPEEIRINNTNYNSFSIIFPSKIRKFFFIDKNLIIAWITHIKKAVGYENFLDYYDLKEVIGEGKFGVVHEGVHKKSGEKVAIKIIKKEKMNNCDIELIRTEIDIMKLCQHPNIVKLLDHFENHEYIFLVMELISGKNLNKYLHRRMFKLTELETAHIIFQISCGLKYLHQYGILHRDLKPDNIMLSDASSKPAIKIMDFGLSKILGPNEKVVEGYGTLSFIAPEVLVKHPYNKQIDIWSLGIILYYMLSGDLPFDDENDNQETIAKQTVFQEVKFPNEKWRNKSSHVIDLISKCLLKNPEKRITINAFLEHDWIQRNNKK